MHFANKVAIAVTMAVASLITVSGAVAQIGEFKCPKSGTVVSYGDGTVATVQLVGTNYCRVHTKQPNGSDAVTHWFAPTLSIRDNSADAYANQLKPSTLWPLAVGKKLTGQFSGAGATVGFQGTWEITVTVDRVEKITTKAGTFDTFVVTKKEQALSHNYRSTLTNWYAADIGTVVKFTFTDNQGANRASELVSIR